MVVITFFMNKSIIFLSLHLLLATGSMPVFRHLASLLLEGNFQNAVCLTQAPKPILGVNLKNWAEASLNELKSLTVTGTSLTLHFHSSLFSIILTSCMFSFPLFSF